MQTGSTEVHLYKKPLNPGSASFLPPFISNNIGIELHFNKYKAKTERNLYVWNDVNIVGGSQNVFSTKWIVQWTIKHLMRLNNVDTHT